MSIACVVIGRADLIRGRLLHRARRRLMMEYDRALRPSSLYLNHQYIALLGYRREGTRQHDLRLENTLYGFHHDIKVLPVLSCGTCSLPDTCAIPG